jgi:Zn-dependent protease with chaperone function
MQYENPPVDHEVNVSRESVLAEFLRLCAGLALLVLVAAAFLYFAGGWMARMVPFSFERDLVGDSVLGLEEYGLDDVRDPAALRQEAYLQRLVDRLAAGMHLPEGMTLHVHLAESDVPNAFATLGGHIVVTRGLYRRMPNENALALVLAHEIAHIRARDPISAIGGGAAVGLTLALISGEADALVPQVGHLVSLGYSRGMESDADAAAVQGVRAAYGHARGADEAFAALLDYRQDDGMPSVPTLLSTHPADDARLARMREAANVTPGETTPLPASFED